MRMIAHRGMNRLALENTLPAFEFAVLRGMDGVELDVQLAACGTPVVFHDDNLERLYGISGTVREMTAMELRALCPVNPERFDADPRDMGIPTLDEVLRLLPDVDFLVNVEIKSSRLELRSPTRATAEVLSKHHHEFVVSSFNPVELARLARMSPGLRLGFLYDVSEPLMLRTGWPARILQLTGLAALHPNWALVSPWLVDWAHGRGLEVNVWTVNDRERVKWLEREGVDAVITDELVPEQNMPVDMISRLHH